MVRDEGIELDDLLACPRDHSALARNGDTYVCQSCQTLYPRVNGVVNFLAGDERFASLSYEIPWHGVPPAGPFRPFLAWLRTMPTYPRLAVTSDHFSLAVERLIYLTSGEARAVLDIGCREGHNLMLAKRARVVVGVDIDVASVVYADRYSPPNCHGLLASGTRLPFHDHAFDFVICTEVIEHLEEYEGLVQEIARVTAPRGQVLLSTPSGDLVPVPDNPLHVQHFTSARLKGLFADRFASVELRTIVTNCQVRRGYWQFTMQHPRSVVRRLGLNAITNLRYYLGGYHHEDSHSRPDVSAGQLVMLARK